MSQVGVKLLRRVRSRLSRIRHFRGHGIHSPYIYAIVREVFMTRRKAPVETLYLCDILQCSGELSRRYSVELQNVASHCNYRSFAVDTIELSGVDLVVVTIQYPAEKIEALASVASKCGTTVAILRHESRAEREAACDRIVAEHKSTTVRRSEYLLIFNNHLPKQHFEL